MRERETWARRRPLPPALSPEGRGSKTEMRSGEASPHRAAVEPASPGHQLLLRGEAAQRRRGVFTATPRTVPPGRTCPRDRKSTRLNSSHSQISYAVFCLKKITIINTLVDRVSDRVITYGQF